MVKQIRDVGGLRRQDAHYSVTVMLSSKAFLSQVWKYYHTNTRKNTNVNTLKPEQNGRYFADDILTCIFLNKNILILKKKTRFLPKGQIDKKSVPLM